MGSWPLVFEYCLNIFELFSVQRLADSYMKHNSLSSQLSPILVNILTLHS